MKKILKILLLTIMSLICIAVVYTTVYRAVFVIINNRSISQGIESDFSELSNGITWIEDSYNKTLIFIPSYKEASAEALYGDWLKSLHREYKVNIISFPFPGEYIKPSLRNPLYSPQRRSSEIIHMLRMYSNMLEEEHEVSVLSTGDGSIQAFEIGASSIKIDKFILLSPAHQGLDLKGGHFFYRLANLPLGEYVFPWLPAGYGKWRVGKHDIMNDDLNEQFEGKYGLHYPGFYNMSQEKVVSRAVEQQDLSSISNNRFFIIYGDDDLTYSLEGFERMGDALEATGNEVSILRINHSGRMVMFDNGRERILDLIAILHH